MGNVFYQFQGDYKQQLIDHVRLLSYLVNKSNTTYAQRMLKVTDLTDAYIAQTGTRPESAQLDRLSDLVMFSDLRDKNPHKSTQGEYPILSHKQLDRRRFGGRGNDTNMIGETSLEKAEHVGVDGRDYRYPNRRERTIDELIYVDATAKIRNEERSLQYKKDTAAGKLVRYNLHDTNGELTEPFVKCRSIKYRAVPEYYR
ncbi:hypothetical protein [Paenibacillus dakarensis]|uniref:hypothetical protein n=1 Tax=Paenibacillus dakarensis TaxID=1527293 RepID=UPI0006D52CA4|nr:hypothetical protein [Paenibacillus dakarensis]